MKTNNRYLYGGFSGAVLPIDSFELGKGIILKRTYAHLMSPCIMAFSKPVNKGPHPGPWKVAKGGFGFDIEIEIKVPTLQMSSKNDNSQMTIWLIAALLRIAQVPFLMVPILSDQPFNEVLKSKQEPVIEPYEIEKCIWTPPNESNHKIELETLEWIKEKWNPAIKLFKKEKKFAEVFKAFDGATIQGKPSHSLLALWGSLEQLFSFSSSEMCYRVSSMLATYLNPPGKSRHDMFNKVLELYRQRSKAAHSAKDIGFEPLVETYIMMRNVLIQIIDKNCIPAKEDLEVKLFEGV